MSVPKYFSIWDPVLRPWDWLLNFSVDHYKSSVHPPPAALIHFSVCVPHSPPQVYLELNQLVVDGVTRKSRKFLLCMSTSVVSTDPGLPYDLVKCSRQAETWLAFMFDLRERERDSLWAVEYLTLKSPFSDSSSSRNLIPVQHFLFKTLLPAPLLFPTSSESLSAATGSSLPWRTDWPQHTCHARGEHELSALCWPAHRPPAGRLSCVSDAGFSPEPGAALPSCFSSSTSFRLCEALPQGPWDIFFFFNSVTMCCLFIQHVFAECLLCSWHFAACWELKAERSMDLATRVPCLAKIW